MLAIISILLLVIIVALVIFYLAASWKVFEKAGQPGWAFIVPFYNGWVLAKIGGKPPWWGLIAAFSYGGGRIDTSNQAVSRNVVLISLALFLVSFAFYIQISIGVAKNFGKSTGFGLLLSFVPFVGYPILAFGPAVYKKR